MLNTKENAEALIRKYMNLGVLDTIPQKIEVVDKSFRRDLMVSADVYDVLKKRRPDLLMYLLPWVKFTNISERGEVVKVQYPYERNQDDDLPSTYMLNGQILGNFWYHKLYTSTPDFESFEECELIGGGSFMYELPGRRNSVDDGQLKITVDAVLAVDALDSKDNQNILVVGCSSEGGALSGLAYEVIGEMVTHTQFDMYDPYTLNVEYMMDTNNYTHIKAEYNYEQTEKYDLVLDDAWLPGKGHEQLDPSNNVYEAKHYSVKRLPWIDQFPVGNVYTQLFLTEMREERDVSRAIIYDYKNLPLGTCAACIELKYLLKGNYSLRFFEAFMNAHKRNCKTGEMRKLQPQDFLKLEMQEIEHVPLIVKKNLYRLSWDLEMVDFPVLPDNTGSMKGACVVVSSQNFLTSRVVNSVSLIVMFQGDKFLGYGNFDKYGIKPKNNVKMKVVTKKIETVVRSHTIGTDRKDFSPSLQLVGDERASYSFYIKGKVTSVGMRVMYTTLMKEKNITGWVKNEGIEVIGEMTGRKCDIQSLIEFLKRHKLHRVKNAVMRLKQIDLCEFVGVEMR